MNHGPELNNTKEQITPVAVSEVMGAPVPAGTVVLSFKLSIGKVGITDIPMFTNEAIAALPIIERDLISKEFLYWALRAINLSEEIDDAAMGKVLNKAKLSRLRIPLPPLRQQQKIVDILNRAAGLRKRRRDAIGRLAELLGSVFLDMFGDPGSNPQGWPMRRMADLFKEKPTLGTMIPGSSDGDWLCLRVANIQNWDIDLSDRKYVDLPTVARPRHEVCDGDLLLARAIATEEHLGKAIVAYPGNDRWAFDSHLMRLRFNEREIKPEYVRALLRTAGGRRAFLGVTRRSAVQYNINSKEIAELEIPVPPIDRQADFVAVVRSTENLRECHRGSLVKMSDLFAALQYRVFAGEL